MLDHWVDQDDWDDWGNLCNWDDCNDKGAGMSGKAGNNWDD